MVIYHISRWCYAVDVLIVLGPGPVHDQSPGGAVGAPVPAVSCLTSKEESTSFKVQKADI